MAGEISLATRTEILGAIRSRYGEASKKDKSRMLDGFVAMTGCHRKHAVRLLDKSRDGGTVRKRYEKPVTPCDRLLRRDDVSEGTKQRLVSSRIELDPRIVAAHDTGSAVGACFDQGVQPGERIDQ